MLASLLNVPRTSTDWSRWSFSHQNSHVKIGNAILAQGGPNLPIPVLDPVNFNAVKTFLERNQQAHTDMNNVLGLQGSDLEGVDIGEVRELQGWIWDHYLEHQAAEQALKV